MELIKTARKHGTLVSELIYIVLNISLALGALLLVYLFSDLPVLAYILIFLSKWRVLAVRPRFWWDNFQANLLDLLLGLSVVTMLWQAKSVFILQVVITILYIIWLIALKPMTSRFSIQAQAAVAQFVAITALYSASYIWPSWTVVMGMWVIGYISARHTLGAFDEEDDVTLLSLLWGLFVAELGWLAYHWSIAYSIVATDSIFKIPQIAIIITVISYFATRMYTLHSTGKKKVIFSDYLWPAVFSFSIIFILLLLFNTIDPNN